MEGWVNIALQSRNLSISFLSIGFFFCTVNCAAAGNKISPLAFLPAGSFAGVAFGGNGMLCGNLLHWPCAPWNLVNGSTWSNVIHKIL